MAVDEPPLGVETLAGLLQESFGGQFGHLHEV
jgi:hypothetical protein